MMSFISMFSYTRRLISASLVYIPKTVIQYRFIHCTPTIMANFCPNVRFFVDCKYMYVNMSNDSSSGDD